MKFGLCCTEPEAGRGGRDGFRWGGASFGGAVEEDAPRLELGAETAPTKRTSFDLRRGSTTTSDEEEAMLLFEREASLFT